MTAQIHDSIIWQDRKFSIVGVNGKSLFHPLEYNLQPFSTVTSCWRGYVCEYKIHLNQLVLNVLQINLRQQGPAIHAVEPLFTKGMFNNVYQDVNLPMDFTGEILAGDTFIRELYVHMGFQPAWKYATVYELVISQGSVLETKDVSQQMAEMRERLMDHPPRPPER